MNISDFILTEMANDEEIQKLGWNMGNIKQLAEATDELLRFAFIYNEYTHENYTEKVEAIAHTIAKYINELIDDEQYTSMMTGMGFIFDKREDFVNEAFRDFRQNLEIEKKYIRLSECRKDSLHYNDFKHIFPRKLPVVLAKRQQIIAKNKERMEKTLKQWNEEDIRNGFFSNPIFECTNVFDKHCVNQERKKL